MKKIACVALVQTFDLFAEFVGIECCKGRGIILPGGKWEPGETFKQAAKRELYEEADLVATKMELVFSGIADDGWYVYTFLTEVQTLSVGFESGEGFSLLVNRAELLKSCYGAYYELLFEALDKRIKS